MCTRTHTPTHTHAHTHAHTQTHTHTYTHTHGKIFYQTQLRLSHISLRSEFATLVIGK